MRKRSLLSEQPSPIATFSFLVVDAGGSPTPATLHAVKTQQARSKCQSLCTHLYSTAISYRRGTWFFLSGFRNGLLRTLGPNEEKVMDKLNKTA